jgi:hypothetical protein
VVDSASAWEALPSLKDGGQYLKVSEAGDVTQTAERNTRAVTISGRRFNPPKGHSVLSPDQTLVYTSFYPMPVVLSAQVGVGGKVAYEWPYFVLQQAPHGSCFQGGMSVDVDGRLYVATELGIQIFDQAGRVNSIIPTPGIATDVCFGGKDFRELFMVCRAVVYKRPTKVKGIVSGYQAPIKPAAPKL